MTSQAQSAGELTRWLSLRIAPVAVTFVEAPPAGAVSPSQVVAAGCSFWELGATQSIVTATKDHELCSIGVYTHNLAEPSPSYSSELQTVLGVLDGLHYASPQDVARLPVLNRRPRYIHYAPLSTVQGAPDVVLLFVDARQSLVIAEAVERVDDGLAVAMGRPACAVIPHVVNTGRAALSLGCCGARAYLGVLTDDVALWALPGARIAHYAAAIAQLGSANEMLGRFHLLRLHDVRQGHSPSYQESLARLQSSQSQQPEAG